MSDGSAKECFLEALDHDGSARAAYLARLAAEDPVLAARVERLLAAHDGRLGRSLEALGRVARLQEPESDAVGSTVGDYELLEEVASGAAGVVWRARQRSLERVVALKVLRAGRLAGRREIERFRREAEAVARFHHPNIVPVHEVGEHEGRHFFSMPYFAGGSLAERVGPGRPWRATEAAELVRTLARAVHHAHQRGLLHRDLKPSNVLLDEAGTPAVADFGVAADLRADGVAEVTTTLSGTPSYMAPEQTGGTGAGELTVATDVWALGCLFYELLSGRPPFPGESVGAVLEAIRTAAPFPLRALAPNVPRDLETITLRCLQKDPARRYPSANALAVDLGRWLEHEPILARRTRLPGRLVLAWRRNPVVASLAALVLVLVTALAIGGVWAETQLEARLREAYLGQARATRLSDDFGRRARALDLLRRANDLRPGPDLRDEAVACLALTDVTPRSTLPFEMGSVGPASVDAALTRLACADLSGSLVVRELPGGRELARIPHDGRCEGLVLAADGKRVLAKFRGRVDSAGDDLCVFALPDGRELLTLPLGWSGGAAALDPAGTLLAVGDPSGRVAVHRVEDGAALLALELGRYVGGLLLAADGGSLVVASGDEEGGVVQVYALSDTPPSRGDDPRGRLQLELPVGGRPYALAWLPDEAGVVAALGDYTAAVLAFDGPADEVILRGHRAEVVSACVTGDGALVATSSWDRTLRLWDPRSGDELARLPGNALGFSADGERLVYGTVQAFVQADVVHGESLRILHGHRGKSPSAVTLSPDSERLATYGTDGAILWSRDSARPLGWLTRTAADGIEFTADGEHLYVSGTGGLERRSCATPFRRGEVLLEGDQDMCDLAADGSLLAVREGRRIRLLEPDSGRVLRELEGYPGLEFLTVSPKGTYVVGMTWHGSGLSVWRSRDGALLGRLCEDRSALGAAVSRDERRLVVGDGVVYRVFALPSLEPLASIEREVGMRENPATLAFSADGRLLALGMSAETVALFDAESLERLLRLEAPGASFDRRLEFAPNGDLLAIASENNRTYLWDLSALRRGMEALGIGWPEGPLHPRDP